MGFSQVFVLASTQAHFGVADAVSSRAARAGGEGGARVESAAKEARKAAVTKQSAPHLLLAAPLGKSRQESNI